MPRKAITKATRFEVFKRDSFTCQYCGKKAPEIVLHIDHIEPVSKGGTSDILNLITSCIDCNLGKANRRLNDNSVITKQFSQLKELQERKEQLEMMMLWQKGLLSLERDAVAQASDYWAELAHPFYLTETGKNGLLKLLSKYPLAEILEAMKIAVRQYIVLKEDVPTAESIEIAWKYVSKICRVRQVELEKPYFKDILYIRGILRNRFNYCDEPLALDLLEQAVEGGATIEELKRLAKSAYNWTEWHNGIYEFIKT